MEDVIAVQIPVDSDGFIEYKCPFCKKRFRLKTNEFNKTDKRKLMCAYCGISSDVNKFIPEDVEKYIHESATQYVQSEVNSIMKQLNHNSKFFSISFKSGKPIEPKKIYMDEGMTTIINCKKCNKKIKIDDCNELKHCCPYCEEIF